MLNWLIPEDAFPELFHAVQMAGIFPDSKTFADYRPKHSIAEINESFQQKKNQFASNEELLAFVKAHFEPPHSFEVGDLEQADSVEAHLQRLWPQLTRTAQSQDTGGSLLPLKHDYVVPGGRFREVYYWDSYFTMLGLLEDGRKDLCNSILKNFAFLIDELGFIPNGNRSYFRTRSQPPFFGLMIALVEGFCENQQEKDQLWQEFGPALQKEYDFWMDGAAGLKDGEQHRRVCKTQGFVLNRYWDDSDLPRPESYREDVELAEQVSDPASLTRHLRAACESGWDFSSRWYTPNGNGLADIEAASVIPVDLNVLLAATERLLAVYHRKMGNEVLAGKLSQAHMERLKAVGRLFWQESLGWYTDLNVDGSARMNRISMAGAYPFFAGYADPEKAKVGMSFMQKHLLRDGGLLSTPNTTDQQWDAPNGWAPLQWIGYRAAERFGYSELADQIAQRWMKLNESVYRRTGKMMEKYNVTDLSLDAGGGEYDLQDGFGWTNGVYMALKRSVEVRLNEKI